MNWSQTFTNPEFPLEELKPQATARHLAWPPTCSGPSRKLTYSAGEMHHAPPRNRTSLPAGKPSACLSDPLSSASLQWYLGPVGWAGLQFVAVCGVFCLYGWQRIVPPGMLSHFLY